MHPTTGLVRELVEAAVNDLSWATKEEKEELRNLLNEGFVILTLEKYEKLIKIYE